MGYYNIKIFITCISLFFLLSLIIISFACPSPSFDKLQATAPVSNTESQALQIKKTDFKNGKGTMKKKKKKTTKKFNPRPNFSAMLPKGYVPPSGSSHCHNLYPNSVTFFCGVSAEGYPP